MHCQFPTRSSVKVSALMLSLMICSTSDACESTRHSDCVAELTRAVSVHKAALDVADARIQLEDWKLSQLKSLRKRGHASWLEVARQQLVSDALLRRRAAIAEFIAFAQSLLQRVLLASESIDVHAPTQTDAAVAPIKLTAHGSVRLVGWIEAGQVPRDVHSLLAARAHSQSRQAGGDHQLMLAKEKLSRAEKRCKVYASHTSIEPNQLRQAELLCSLARAEAQFHQIKFDQGADKIRHNAILNVDWDEHVTQSEASGSAVGWAENYLTPRSNFNLGLATLRVAESEASATSELEAAKIDFQRIKRRWESLKKLHASGHATQRELDDARGQLARADLEVEELQTQHAKLTQTYRMIHESLHESGMGESVWEAESRIDFDLRGTLELLDDSWPLPMITDLQVLRHVLELRRNQLDSVAQGEGLLQKKAMLEEYWTKLKQCIANESESTLSEGSRRQLDDLKLEIRYYHARRQATQERLAILTAEQRRFVAQCVGLAENRWAANLPALRRSADESLAPHPTLSPAARGGGEGTVESANRLKMPLHLRAKPVSLIKSPKGGRIRLSYLELDYFGRPEILRRCVLASNRVDDLWLGFGDVDRHPPCNLSWLPSYSYTSLRGGISGRARETGRNQRIDTVDSDRLSAIRNESLRHKRVSARPFKAGNAYPFGILRSDLRSQLTPGQHPWYLPGSPTNFRQRKGW